MKRYEFKHMPIGIRLPFLICCIMLSVILIFGIVSYVGVRNAELKSGKERLSELSNQMGSMFSSNVQLIISETLNKANTPPIKSLLNSGEADSSGRINRHKLCIPVGNKPATQNYLSYK